MPPQGYSQVSTGKENARLARCVTVGITVIITIGVPPFYRGHYHVFRGNELRNQVIHMIVHPAR